MKFIVKNVYYELALSNGSNGFVVKDEEDDDCTSCPTMSSTNKNVENVDKII